LSGTLGKLMSTKEILGG